MNAGAHEQEFLSSVHKQVSTGVDAVVAPLMPSSAMSNGDRPGDGVGQGWVAARVLGRLKTFTNVNELNLLIKFSEKEEISGMRRMVLKVLSTIIFLCLVDIVTSLKIPYATGKLEGCKASFTLLIV